jgi:hypothetical protein
MKLKLKEIPVLPCAKMSCALYTLIGVIVGIILTIVSLATDDDQLTMGLGIWAILVYPLINMVMGFAMGSFIAWFYNLLSKFFGGIECEFEDVGK